MTTATPPGSPVTASVLHGQVSHGQDVHGQDSHGQDLRGRVQEVINLIRPAVQADGGDIELVNVLEDGTVHIRFHGACHGCPSSPMTLHHAIERNLRDRLPQISKVLAVS